MLPTLYFLLPTPKKERPHVCQEFTLPFIAGCRGDRYQRAHVAVQERTLVANRDGHISAYGRGRRPAGSVGVQILSAAAQVVAHLRRQPGLSVTPGALGQSTGH